MQKTDVNSPIIFVIKLLTYTVKKGTKLKGEEKMLYYDTPNYHMCLLRVNAFSKRNAMKK